MSMLPGEDAPLMPRAGGQPVTPDEALGSWRRRVREKNVAFGRDDPIPTELPLVNAGGKSPSVSVRVPLRMQVLALGRAEMEGRTMAEVVNEALLAYIAGSPGTVPVYEPPHLAHRRSRQR